MGTISAVPLSLNGKMAPISTRKITGVNEKGREKEEIEKGEGKKEREHHIESAIDTLLLLFCYVLFLLLFYGMGDIFV